MIIDDVATYLIENIETVDFTLGGNLVKGFMPNEPTEIVGLFDTGGATPDIDLPTGSPTFQVIVRSDNYENAHNIIHEIADLLHNKMNLELATGQTYFYFIHLMGEPGHIGRDAKGNDEFSVNFICRIRR